MRLCLIPARGGSRRIPRKNVQLFAGRPMIEWSIEVACGSDVFDEVVVSTDDEEIAAIARSAGASVPFLRPVSIADDHTPTNTVVADGIERMRTPDAPIDEVCCLYATAPFVIAADLIRGLEVLRETNADFSFAATTYDFPVQRALIFEDGSVRPMHPEHMATRSQDLPEAIHDAGQFYWGSADAFSRFPVLFEAQTVPVMLPRYRVQDIDTMEDWKLAEAMFQALGGSGAG